MFTARREPSAPGRIVTGATAAVIALITLLPGSAQQPPSAPAPSSAEQRPSALAPSSAEQRPSALAPSSAEQPSAPASSSAQQPPSAPAPSSAEQRPSAPSDQADPQRPTFRTGTNIVRVDVAVLDHRGNPIPSLGPDDFLIEEDGVPQKVSSLKFIETTGRADPGDDLSLTIRSPEHAAAEAARDDVRVFLIFWDEYSIEQFASALRAREALGRLISSAFQPTDLVALMDQLTPTAAIRFTRNFNDLALDVRKLRGRLGLYFPTRSAAEDAQLEKGEVRRLRAEVTLSALKAAVVHLGTIREGRKALIFVSEGVRGLGSDGTTILSDLIRAANESNTAIYSVDPRGLTARGGSDSLFILSGNTGGRTIVNTNGLSGALAQVVKESSAFYLLGYSSVRNPADGRFHQIRVRVDRPGVEVRARRGYWAPSLRAVEDAKAAVAAATAPDAVAAALTALTPSTARRLLDFWAGVSLGDNGRPLLSIAWTVRNRPPGGDEPASVGVTVRSGADEQSFDGTVDQRSPSFPVAPGEARVVLTVRDSADRIIDSETRVVQVPDIGAMPLAWASPVLLRGRTPLELRAIASDPDAPPFAGHDFSRTERLFLRLTLVGDTRDAKVSARLVSRSGRELVALPVTPVDRRPGGYQIDLPLSSVAPGDYVIGVEAVGGTQRAETFVAIRVQG